MVWKYIQSDYYRYTGKKLSPILLIKEALFSFNHCYRFTFWLRLASPINNNKFVRLFSKLIYNHYKIKYGIHIPSSTSIGYGFYIGHGVGIVINGLTKIGNNVNVSQFLSIGSNKGTPAVIGDNVYIGPNVSIVENVTIGNNALIAAGATVIRDVPMNSVAAGTPAKNKGENKHPEFIMNQWVCD